jgi:hypothetical protein
VSKTIIFNELAVEIGIRGFERRENLLLLLDFPVPETTRLKGAVCPPQPARSALGYEYVRVRLYPSR